ncbi:MAG: hypothetical protein Q8S21_02860 [Candidatus Paracaedibacteraceae bacterium]|nr:hypothetical protein [Candidatus Paracaedibacteraceae bacterium]
MNLPFSERDFLYLIYGERLRSSVSPLRMHYYQDLYARWQSGERIVWNWVAFLCSVTGLGAVWLIYRRLYLVAFVYLLFTIFLFSACLYWSHAHSIDSFKTAILSVNITFAIVGGLFANSAHLLWLGAWKKAFPTGYMPCGGDAAGVFAFFSFIFFSLGMGQSKFSGIITVLLFSFLVLMHVRYYEKKKIDC